MAATKQQSKTSPAPAVNVGLLAQPAEAVSPGAGVAAEDGVVEQGQRLRGGGGREAARRAGAEVRLVEGVEQWEAEVAPRQDVHRPAVALARVGVRLPPVAPRVGGEPCDLGLELLAPALVDVLEPPDLRDHLVDRQRVGQHQLHERLVAQVEPEVQVRARR